MPECIHGLEFCASCRDAERRQLLRRDPAALGVFRMEAGYDSRCPGCGGFVGAGERIYRLAEREPFVCESCAVAAR